MGRVTELTFSSVYICESQAVGDFRLLPLSISETIISALCVDREANLIRGNLLI